MPGGHRCRDLPAKSLRFLEWKAYQSHPLYCPTTVRGLKLVARCGDVERAMLERAVKEHLQHGQKIHVFLWSNVFLEAIP